MFFIIPGFWLIFLLVTRTGKVDNQKKTTYIFGLVETTTKLMAKPHPILRILDMLQKSTSYNNPLPPEKSHVKTV